MPFKQCPVCNAKCGVRTITCKCGADFSQYKKASPEQTKLSMGEWVDDMPKGMKVTPVKEPMEACGDKLSNDDVKDEISFEGLGYTIYSYIPASRLADKELAKRWLAARQSMQEVVEYLWPGEY